MEALAHLHLRQELQLRDQFLSTDAGSHRSASSMFLAATRLLRSQNRTTGITLVRW